MSILSLIIHILQQQTFNYYKKVKAKHMSTPNQRITIQTQLTHIHPDNNQLIQQLEVHQSQSPNQTQAYSQLEDVKFDKIIINAVVWNKHVHGLFDYQEQHKIVKSTIVIEQNQVNNCINFIKGQIQSSIIKPNTKLVLISRNKDKLLNEQIIELTQINPSLDLSSKQGENQFLCGLKLICNLQTSKISVKILSKTQVLAMLQSVTNNSNSIQCSTSQQSPYFIVRSLASKKNSQYTGYKIYPGDLIRLGKVQFKVVSIDGNNQQEELQNSILQIDQIQSQDQKDIQCKYCLAGRSNNQNDNSFFVNLCDCKGHIGYVHYQCLIKWTKTKSTVEESDHIRIYYLQNLKCQVCTKEFPKHFKYNQKKYNLLPIELPEKHLILSQTSHIKPMTAVISGDLQKEITIGRGRTAMLKVSDITVSREHAQIQRVGDEYFIKDCRSKFGTTVRSSKQALQVCLNKKKGFQINNTIFTIQIISKQKQSSPKSPIKQKQLQKTEQQIHNKVQQAKIINNKQLIIAQEIESEQQNQQRNPVLSNSQYKKNTQAVQQEESTNSRTMKIKKPNNKKNTDKQAKKE